MPRQRKQENETEEQAASRRRRERVANTANRSDKVSWNRKMDNMVKLLAELKPIQDKIIELEASKQPILDQIAELRNIMRKECVHPFDHLVDYDTYILCKFCDKKLNPANDDS
jgi:hypothetical protein